MRFFHTVLFSFAILGKSFNYFIKLSVQSKFFLMKYFEFGLSWWKYGVNPINSFHIFLTNYLHKL